MCLPIQPESRVARQGFFHDRRAVRERAIPDAACVPRNALRQAREPATHNLVVVAAECVARHVAKFRVCQHGLGGFGLDPIVHARTDHAQRAGNQLVRTRPARAVPLHVAHGPVPLLLQPRRETAFVVGQVDAGHANLLEAEFPAPGLDGLGKRVEIHDRQVGRADVGAQYNRAMHPLSAGIYSADQVRALDRRAIEQFGVPGYELMTRAGHATWNALRAAWPDARSVGVLCGPGNNGGDGYVLARIARAQGLQVTAIALGDPSALAGDARHAFDDFGAAGGSCAPWQPHALDGADVIVDALFGIGLARAVEGPAAEVIGRINATGRPVVAVDIPVRTACGHRRRAWCRNARRPHGDLHWPQGGLLPRCGAGSLRPHRLRRP